MTPEEAIKLLLQATAQRPDQSAFQQSPNADPSLVPFLPALQQMSPQSFVQQTPLEAGISEATMNRQQGYQDLGWMPEELQRLNDIYATGTLQGPKGEQIPPQLRADELHQQVAGRKQVEAEQQRQFEAERLAKEEAEQRAISEAQQAQQRAYIKAERDRMIKARDEASKEVNAMKMPVMVEGVGGKEVPDPFGKTRDATQAEKDTRYKQLFSNKYKELFAIDAQTGLVDPEKMRSMAVKEKIYDRPTGAFGKEQDIQEVDGIPSTVPTSPAEAIKPPKPPNTKLSGSVKFAEELIDQIQEMNPARLMGKSILEGVKGVAQWHEGKKAKLSSAIARKIYQESYKPVNQLIDELINQADTSTSLSPEEKLALKQLLISKKLSS